MSNIFDRDDFDFNSINDLHAILDENHNVKHVPMIEWGNWMADFDNRQVAKDSVRGLLVSTVFLGLDHGFRGTPQWFETMVFIYNTEEDRQTDLYCDRYETWDQAMAGHTEIVQRIKNGDFDTCQNEGSE